MLDTLQPASSSEVMLAGQDVLSLQGIVVLCCCWCRLQFEVPGKWGFAAVVNTMHPQRIFFSLLKLDFSWMSINCFHGFFKSSDREGSLIIKEQSKDLQEVSSDENISNYFIRSTTPASVSLMWRITMSKQCCPCVPSEIIAKTLIVYGKVFRFFIHLIVWRHRSCGRIAKEYKFKETKEQKVSHQEGKKFSSEWELFFKKLWIS